MKVCVVYDTRYRNTEKIARSLEAGLKRADIQTVCTYSKEINLESLKEFDLICVGAPTEWHTAVKPTKEFLSKLKHVDISGKFGFAFDTRLTRPLSGSAAKLIENELRNLGLQIIAPRESAIVYLENGRMTGAWLKEGEEKRFEAIGFQVGNVLLSASKMAIRSQ